MTSNKITRDELNRHAHLKSADPPRYLEMVNRLIAQDPEGTNAYFSRYQVWMERGEYEKALADLDRCRRRNKIERIVYRFSRGELFRLMERWRDAIVEFDMAQAISPRDWKGISGAWHRADCHARLGDLERALADCATLRDGHWRPSMDGLPGGDKAQVAAELRRRAKAANVNGKR